MARYRSVLPCPPDDSVIPAGVIRRVLTPAALSHDYAVTLQPGEVLQIVPGAVIDLPEYLAGPWIQTGAFVPAPPTEPAYVIAEGVAEVVAVGEAQ